MLKTNPPQKPSQDFFGDIRSKSLCLPNAEPTQKAPVSLIHIIMNIASTTAGPEITEISDMQLNGKATYRMLIAPEDMLAIAFSFLMYSWKTRRAINSSINREIPNGR